jgi:tetratricopeptide (TPR) repeat protein
MMMQYLDEAVTSCESLLSPPKTDFEGNHKNHNSEHAVQSSDDSDDSDNADRQSAAQLSWTQACQTVGNILTSMGFIEEAYPWRSMALDPLPDRAKFYAQSGRIYSQCEVWDRAIHFYQQALEQQPDSVDIRCQLAKIYHQLGDYRAESQVIHQLLLQHPDKATAEGYFQLGQVLQSQGQKAQAAICFQRAIEQDKQFAKAYYALGDLLAHQNQQAQAVKLFQQLIEHLSKPDLIVNLASNLSDLSTDSVNPENLVNPETNIAILQASVDLTGTKAMAQYRLGRAYRQAQQLEQAVVHFRAALQLDNRLHWAYMGLLNVLMQMQQWDEVITTCQGIIRTVEAFPWAYGFMGNALARKGEIQKAQAAHQQSFALRGWQRCADRGYEFTQTWFGESIPIWQRCLAPLNENKGLRSPLHFLLLGSRDSSSLCWLADEMLQQPDDQLTCITPEVSSALRNNIAKQPNNNRSNNYPDNYPGNISFRIGELSQQLQALAIELDEASGVGAFEMIYIQSDRKQADYLKALAIQSWALLKPAGVMIFKDYQWSHPTDRNQSAQVGIDDFIASVADYAEILHQSHQVILKKQRHRPISQQVPEQISQRVSEQIPEQIIAPTLKATVHSIP